MKNCDHNSLDNGETFNITYQDVYRLVFDNYSSLSIHSLDFSNYSFNHIEVLVFEDSRFFNQDGVGGSVYLQSNITK